MSGMRASDFERKLEGYARRWVGDPEFYEKADFNEKGELYCCYSGFP